MSHPATSELSHWRVLRIALPIMLSGITVPLLGAVDTGVVGQMGEAAPIAAVGVGALTLGTIYWAFGFRRMGTTGLVAQAAGAGDRVEVAALWSRGLMIGLAAGLALMLLYLPMVNFAFRFTPQSAEVEGFARQYMAIRIWSAPAAIALYAVMGWLIARERTGRLLSLQIWMNGVNIVLDFAFVLGLGWGVPGVAWATFLAEWSGLALGLWLCRDVFTEAAWRDWSRIADRARLIRMARINSDIMVRSFVLAGGLWIFVTQGGRFGDATHAANQILLQLFEIASFALDGFALAAETLVGQAVGRRALGDLRRSVWISSIWGLGIALAMVVAFFALGGWFVMLMTTSGEVQAEGFTYLPWLIAVPLLGLPSFMLDGIFTGATRTRDMRNMMLLSAAAYGVALVVLVPLWGNHGLWAALMIFIAMRGVTLALRYPALERDLMG